MQKKWSDLKIATKKHVAALQRSTTQTGGAQPGTDADWGACDWVYGVSYNIGISDGGDADAPPVSEPDNGKYLNVPHS